MAPTTSKNDTPSIIFKEIQRALCLATLDSISKGSRTTESNMKKLMFKDFHGVDDQSKQQDPDFISQIDKFMIGSGRYADMTEKVGNEIYLSSVLYDKKALLGTDITKPLLHQATKKKSEWLKMGSLYNTGQRTLTSTRKAVSYGKHFASKVSLFIVDVAQKYSSIFNQTYRFTKVKVVLKISN